MGAALSAEKTTHNKTNIEYIKIPSFSRINIQACKSFFTAKTGVYLLVFL